MKRLDYFPAWGMAALAAFWLKLLFGAPETGVSILP
jgi:hypothetical protein